MECGFCQKSHIGDKIYDNKNRGVNNLYLTCVNNYLRLWESSTYVGCYKINYCPICGRNLNI